MTDVRLVAASANRLGEGPVWAAAEARLYWFDIKGRRLNWHAPARDETGGYDLPCRASAAAVRAGGGLLLATEAGLAEIDPASGAVRMRQAFDFGDGFRSNDGNVDPMGRFWWTTMDDNHGERPGEIFRTDPGGATERLLGGIQIPNTVAFSPDGATFYLADSRRQTLFAYETATCRRCGSSPIRAAKAPRRTARRSMPRAICGTPSGAAGGSCAMTQTARSTGSSPCQSARPAAAPSADLT